MNSWICVGDLRMNSWISGWIAMNDNSVFGSFSSSSRPLDFATAHVAASHLQNYIIFTAGNIFIPVYSTAYTYYSMLSGMNSCNNTYARCAIPANLACSCLTFIEKPKKNIMKCPTAIYCSRTANDQLIFYLFYSSSQGGTYLFLDFTVLQSD